MHKRGGVILLEGPDATGKTTLANRLLEMFGGGTYIHLEYRFKKRMPEYHGWALRKALRLAAKGELVIIDRLHITEYIYAKIFRGGSPWPWMLGAFTHICDKCNVITIMCIPNTAQQGVDWFNEALNERPEMYTNITNVIKEFIKFSVNNPQYMTYNKEWSEGIKRAVYTNIKYKLGRTDEHQ